MSCAVRFENNKTILRKNSFNLFMSVLSSEENARFDFIPATTRNVSALRNFPMI